MFSKEKKANETNPKGQYKGVWEDHLHTAIFKTDNQQRPNVQEKK